VKWRFLGVRGSIPTPEADKLKYGGNTSCYQLIVDGVKEAFIFDAGTGIRQLGKELVREKVENYHLFISHIHWDHIQGLPFFLPLYLEDNTFFFYGALKVDAKLKDSLRGQMDSFYFPVKLDELRANMIFTEVIEETLLISGVKITVRYQNHPGGSLGFRIEKGGKSIAYCTDAELVDEDKIPKSLSDLAMGADLLVIDAMYDEEDYKKYKKGWGHASWQRVVRFAKELEVKKLYLTHHDPEVSDEELERRLEEGRKIFPNIFLAREGEIVELEENEQKNEKFITSNNKHSFKVEYEKLKFKLDETGILTVVLPPTEKMSEASFEIPELDFEEIEGVCFDFSQVESMDSRKLGKLANLLKMFLDKDITCAAYAINDYMDHLLRITNVYKYVMRCQNLDEAETLISTR
jgi:phosphoribosyl 1,2-cyclic phosphodiesterase/anti-anti-sigma regulatory factor